MDEQAVDRLERDLRQVLVRAVDRVARLEADDALPPALRERGAGLGRVARELGKGRLRAFERRDLAGEVERLLRVEPRDAGVRLVRRAEAPLRLEVLVVLEDLLDLERRKLTSTLVRERDDVALRRRVDGETDRQRPRQSAGEVHLLDDGDVVLAVHEPLERRERAARDHVRSESSREVSVTTSSDSMPSGRSPVLSIRRPPCGLIKRSPAATAVTPPPRSRRGRAPRAA